MLANYQTPTGFCRGVPLFCVLLLSCLVVAAPANAGTIVLNQGDSVTLDQLLGPSADSVLVGDKHFDNFEFAIAPLSAPFDVSADEVTVTGVFTNDGAFGISFLAPFVDFAIDDEQVAYSIEFDVTAKDPNFLISAVELSGEPRVDSGVPGLAQVVESVSLGNTILGTLQIQDVGGPAAPPPVLLSTLTLAQPQSTVSIDKTILLLATDGGPNGPNGQATVNLIEQVFRQVPVPEPSSAVLCLSLCGFLARRRR